jgi:hypothetical protein
MNKTELIDKLLHLGNTTEMCCSTDRHNAKELAHTLIDEYLEAINYTRCCQTVNLEVKPTFEEWLNVNFTKYDNEYYQDNGRNGIWKKHKLYELYENTTL